MTTHDTEENTSVVIIDSETNCVRHCSLGAFDAGIRTEMGLAQVSAIDANTVVVSYSKATEESSLTRLANELYGIASDIVFLPPSGLAINLTPLIRYYQGQQNFTALCHKLLKNLAVTYTFASGKTIEIAEVLAKAKLNRIFTEPDEALPLLHKCELELSRLSAKQLQQFKRSGLVTLGHLLTLPLEEIGKRFPNEVIQYILSLKAIKPCSYTNFHPPQVFRQFYELPYEVETTAALQRYFKMLIQHCCDYLYSRNLVTDQLAFKLILRDQSMLELSVSAGAAHHHLNDWLALVTLKLEKISLLSPAISVQLECNDQHEMSPENLSIFEASYSKHAEQILFGKLLARLGEENVITPRLTNDHRFSALSTSSSGICEQPASIPTPDSRPSWLICNPYPLTENSQIVYGPERLQTGWWDSNPVKRDYFIAETKQGQRLWVFRENEHDWFVHGVFG